MLGFGLFRNWHLGGCQNYGPFLGPCDNTGPSTGPNLGDPKMDYNFDNPPFGMIALFCPLTSVTAATTDQVQSRGCYL